jgi:hypothetical protein
MKILSTMSFGVIVALLAFLAIAVIDGRLFADRSTN